MFTTLKGHEIWVLPFECIKRETVFAYKDMDKKKYEKAADEWLSIS